MKLSWRGDFTSLEAKFRGNNFAEYCRVNIISMTV